MEGRRHRCTCGKRPLKTSSASRVGRGAVIDSVQGNSVQFGLHNKVARVSCGDSRAGTGGLRKFSGVPYYTWKPAAGAGAKNSSVMLVGLLFVILASSAFVSADLGPTGGVRQNERNKPNKRHGQRDFLPGTDGKASPVINGGHSQASKNNDNDNKQAGQQQQTSPASPIPGNLRPKRQMLYYVFSWLGEDSIRNYVKEMDTENIPSLMGSVGPDEIMYIVSVLPPDEIMRVLLSLPSSDILKLAKRMTPDQLMQLLGYVPPEGLTKLTDGFTPEELQQLVVLMPPEGIVQMTKAVPPAQAKKLLLSLSTEAIFNLTQSLPPHTLVELMTSLPPDIILTLTQTLSPSNLNRLLRSLPPEVLVTLVTSLPRDTIRQLVSSLPPGFIESFVEDLKPRDVGKMVENITAAQVMKLLRSFPAERLPDVNSLLKPELITAALGSLPGDLVANLTALLPRDKIAGLLTSAALLPADTIAMVTSAMPADQLVRIVGSIPPEAMAGLLRAVPVDAARTLARAVPVGVVVNMTVALADDPLVLDSVLRAVLSPELISKLSSKFSSSADHALAAFPKETVVEILHQIPEHVMVTLATAGAGTFADLAQQLKKNQLKKMVGLVTPEMLKLLMTSIPPEVMLNVSRVLPRSLVPTFLDVLPNKKLTELMAAVPQDVMMKMISLVSPEEMAAVVRFLPPDVMPRLVSAVPAEVLVALSGALPLDVIVNVTVALSADRDVMSAVMGSVMSPEVITKLTSSFPAKMAIEIVDALPDSVIADLASALPVKKAFNLLNSLSSSPDPVPRNVSQLVRSVPSHLIVKVARAIPPHLIANMSEQLSKNQLKKLVHLLTPDLFRAIVTAVPPGALIGVAKALPENVVATILNVLSPKHLRSLVQAVPPATITNLVDEVLLQNAEERSTDLIVATTQKVANVLLSVPPPVLTRLIKALPRDLLVSVVDSLPPRAVAEAAALLSGEEGVPLVTAIPLEAVAYVASVLPPSTIVRLVEAMPKRTVGAFANMAMRIPTGRMQDFFRLVPVGVLKRVIIQLPPGTIEKLASALPPETVGKIAATISPGTVAPIVESFRPRELRRLIRSVNTTFLSNFVNSIPPSVLSNLTKSLPADAIGKLMTAIPPEVINQLVTSMDPAGMMSLLKVMPPAVIENILTTMPTDLVVNMTKVLPPAQMQDLMDLLPSSMIGKMISILPKDVLVDLVQAFDADAMLDMMQKLSPDQLMGILATLPHEVVLNITKSQTPVQTMKLLDSLPADGIVNLTQAIPTEVMLEMMQSVPPEGLIGLVSSMPLKDLFTLAGQLTPEQMSGVMEKFTADPDLIPNLLASVDLDRMVSMVDAVPIDLLMQIASSVDPSMVMDLVHKFMPKVQKMLLDKMDEGLRKLGRHHPVTFQQCLADLGYIGHSLFNFSEWAFHFLDASGKPSRGILEGNIHMIGNFDQCKKISHVIAGGARNGDVLAGSYCHVQFDIPKEHLPPIPGDGILPMPEIAMDVCLPDSCIDVDLHSFLSTFQLPLNVTIPRVACQQDLDLAEDPAAIITCVVLAIIICLSVLGTVVDCLFLRRSHTFKDNNNRKYSVTGPQQPQYAGTNGHTPIITRSNGARTTVLTGLDDDLKTKEKLLQRQDSDTKGGDVTEMHQLMKKNGESANGDGVSLHSHNADNVIIRDDTQAPTSLTVGLPPLTLRVTDAGGKWVVHHSEEMNGAGGTWVCHNGEEMNGVTWSDVVGLRASGWSSVTVTVSRRDVATQAGPSYVAGERAGLPYDSLWLRVLTSFSVARSIKAMVTTHDLPENIHCLHGIRVLSMLWVIFANSVVFGALYFENLLHAANDLISMPAQVILNSSLSQDSFFAISGVITAVMFLKAVSISGRFKPGHLIYYYVHRLIRVIPPYAVVLLVCACLLGHMANGPHWPPPLQEQCLNQWWTNLLFINNYFVSIEHMCMSWTWFLSNLMQFYWVAPLALVPFAYGKKIVGFAVIGLLVALHITSTVILEININGDVLRRQSDYFWSIYQQPWCRVSPFALGLGMGFLLHRVKFQCSMNKIIALVGWLVAVTVSTTLCLITYEENRYLLQDASGWSVATRTIHETLQRPLWACVVCWVVFACSTGNGGPINKVLSWRGFLPMSRLSYCVYLIHPVVIICDLLAYRVFAYFTIGYVLFRYISYVVVSYFLALVLAVLIQAPVLALEKAILSAFKTS